MIPGIGYAIAGGDAMIFDDEAFHDPSVNAVEIDFDSPFDRVPAPRYVIGGDCEVVSVRAIELDVTAPQTPHADYLDALRAISLKKRRLFRQRTAAVPAAGRNICDPAG